VRRRDFISITTMTSVWPLLARAQQPKPMPVIGVLGAGSPDIPGIILNLAAFREALAETGYNEGQNVAIEYRWAERRAERLPALAAELVARKVDVIVTEGGDVTTLAAKNATSTIPIVFHGLSDPVALGWAGSLNRPGGNLTGVNMLGGELIPKLRDLLLELVPQAKLIGVLQDPSSPLDLKEVASATGARLEILPAFTESEIDAALATLLERKVQGLIAYTVGRARIAAHALQHGVPAIALFRDFPENGGLLSYGPSIPAAYRVKGIYTGRILKGEKAANLPIERPNKLEMVANLKTAKALDVAIPQSLLARADMVIE
jgi:putative ABC transport system substrate-binding protein